MGEKKTTPGPWLHTPEVWQHKQKTWNMDVGMEDYVLSFWVVLVPVFVMGKLLNLQGICLS